MFRQQLLDNEFETLGFFGNDAQIPEVLALYFLKRISRDLLTGPIKPDNSTLRIEYHNESADSVKNRRSDVAFFLQSFFNSLKFSDVEANTVDKPGAAILAADQ